MRGVHQILGTGHPCQGGSSPHARGPLNPFGELNLLSGIIPACAGSTRNKEGNGRFSKDHPRMRGVHHHVPRHKYIVPGSSPHARGPQYHAEKEKNAQRIIPACAGSTRNKEGNGRFSKDHPRMRGVHHHVPRHKYIVPGSSPHARGPQYHAEKEKNAQRIIPACAGSTPPAVIQVGRTRDHPRMRGVHVFVGFLSTASLGSSPHARGPRTGRYLRRLCTGIIPACAGSTPDKGCFISVIEDHPRMRGVHRYEGGNRA